MHAAPLDALDDGLRRGWARRRSAGTKRARAMFSAYDAVCGRIWVVALARSFARFMASSPPALLVIPLSLQVKAASTMRVFPSALGVPVSPLRHPSRPVGSLPCLSAPTVISGLHLLCQPPRLRLLTLLLADYAHRVHPLP